MSRATLPPSLHAAYDWTDAAGVLDELRVLANDAGSLAIYAAASEEDAAAIDRDLGAEPSVFAADIAALAKWLADQDEEDEDEEEESEKDAAYGLAQCVEAMAYAAYLAAGTGPQSPAAYAAFVAAKAATEAARFARRDAKFRGSL